MNQPNRPEIELPIPDALEFVRLAMRGTGYRPPLNDQGQIAPVRDERWALLGPVVGALDPSYDHFGTGFSGFDSSYGVSGLARVEPEELRLDLLAFVSREPGTGQFSRFMAACQRHYRHLVVWEIISARAEGLLRNFGFQWGGEWAEVDGCFLPVMRWIRP